MPERIVPIRAILGDVFNVSLPPPTEATFEYPVSRVGFSYGNSPTDTENTVYQDTLGTSGNYDIRIDAFSPTGASGGVVFYSLFVDGQVDGNPVRKTLEWGRIYIQSPASLGGDTRDEQLLDKLYEILFAKLDNRGDIMSYQVGGRNVATMSIQEINDQIQVVRNRIETKRRGARVRSHRQW